MKKLIAVLCSICMIAAMLTGCGGKATEASTEGGTSAGSDIKIALITMDSIDQHWITLNEGAQAKAKELGVEVTFMSPNTKDDAQQIECVNNAVAGGYQAIMVAANGPDAISSALKEAADKGVKIVYVDSPANVEAEATFSTDNKAAGATAGEEMKKALEAKGITSGTIGIINVNAATDSCVMREEGFRSAFEGTGFELLETQYGEGDAAKSQSIAENYITQGVVGIFGCNEGSTTGAGNAIKASGSADVIGVGFDKSDAILGLIDGGFLLCTMAQNPDVMGSMGVEAAVKAINGESLGGVVTDTGVSVLSKEGGDSASAAGSAAASQAWKIALITMDSIDQHWITLNEGAQAKAKELGVEVTFMSPNTKDDAQQIECVNNAVAGGYQAIMVAANGPDAISSALKEAAEKGVKIVYVDSPANVEAEATFSTDNKAAGATAGEELKKALEAKGVTSGTIGIINVNAATDSCVMREEGFRSAFEGTGFELLETQYGEGDAAKSQSIAENYITQGVVGIFGCNEGSTTGAGNAIKASGNADIIGVGFDKSDAILGLIDDGYLLCTMAQNPDVMGSMGVEACVKALEGESLGGVVEDTGVSVLTK